MRIVRKTKLAHLALLGAALTLPGGCTPSVQELKRMRLEVHPETAQRNQARILTCFERTAAPAAWRAEAMTTMAAIDARFRHATAQPESHKRLVRLLRQEYRRPKISLDEGPGHVRRLRAWSLQALGRVDRPNDVSLLLEALRRHTNSNDPKYRIRMAALDSISTQIPVLRAEPALRAELLYCVAAISAELRGKIVSKVLARRVRPMLQYFETTLKSYPDVVSMLPAPDSTKIDRRTLMEILTWNYQKLTARKRAAAPAEGRELFERNVTKLLGLAWDRRAEIRTRCRVILAEFAPLALFRALAERVRGQPETSAEDCEHLANVLPAADTAARNSAALAESMAYVARRKRAFASLFEKLSGIPVASREIIYARLAAHDPDTLAGHLIAANPTVLAENTRRMLQHIRYLGRLREKAPKAAGALEQAIAAFLPTPAPAVRRQVAAHLLEDRPILLAASHVPTLRACSSEKPSDAAGLVDSYLACLERIESRQKDRKPYTENLVRRFGAHPYAALEGPLAREELALKGTIARFLAPRDPNRLVSMLCRDIAARSAANKTVYPPQYAMLGDTMQSGRTRLEDPVFTAAVAVLRKGLSSASEDQSLLCCRYLLELNCKISPAETRRLGKAARALVRTAAERPER